MSTSEPAVICRDVVKTYGKGEIAVRALKGVSLEAKFGELLMIVGPSGCGKTTLLIVMAPVPEPEAYIMMLAGLGCVGVYQRRKKQQARTQLHHA